MNESTKYFQKTNCLLNNCYYRYVINRCNMQLCFLLLRKSGFCSLKNDKFILLIGHNYNLANFSGI